MRKKNKFALNDFIAISNSTEKRDYSAG